MAQKQVAKDQCEKFFELFSRKAFQKLHLTLRTLKRELLESQMLLRTRFSKRLPRLEEARSIANPFGELLYYWSLISLFDYADLDPKLVKDSPCNLNSSQKLLQRFILMVSAVQQLLPARATLPPHGQKRRVDF